jgi:hypothetical protein
MLLRTRFTVVGATVELMFNASASGRVLAPSIPMLKQAIKPYSVLKLLCGGIHQHLGDSLCLLHHVDDGFRAIYVMVDVGDISKI